MSSSASKDMATRLFDEAFALHQRNEIDSAQRLYEQVIALEPDHARALHSLGAIAYSRGEHREAVAWFRRAVALDGKQVVSHHGLAQALRATGSTREAESALRRAVAIDSEFVPAWQALAELHYQHGNTDEAARSIRKAMELQTNIAEAHNRRGLSLAHVNDLQGAISAFRAGIACNPKGSGLYYNLAKVLMSLGALNDTITCLRQAAKLAPSDSPIIADVHFELGNALSAMRCNVEALQHYDRALSLRPQFPQCLNNRGTVLLSIGRNNDALASFDQALILRPEWAEALSNRSEALRRLARPLDALASAEQSLRQRPTSRPALYNRGNALLDLKRYREALICFDQILSIDPTDLDALINSGAALSRLEEYKSALGRFNQALALSTQNTSALNNRAHTLGRLGRYDDAARAFEQLLRIEPNRPATLGHLFNARLHCCNWREFETHRRKLIERVAEGAWTCRPFDFLAVSDSPPTQLRCARTFVASECPRPRMWGPRHQRHDRIRLAYVSGNFGEHPVSYLLAGLLEKHDRTRFEVIGISLRAPVPCEAVRRIRTVVSQFVDVSDRTETEVAALMRELQVDIAVDLQGWTDGARNTLFAGRPAPIQVNYLGFPGTMGAEFMDYIVADRFVIPEKYRDDYAEKIVYLPDCFQANDDRQRLFPSPSRRSVGLPESHFVFSCFNKSYKITPALFDIWMRLLHAVDGSVLWLLNDNDAVARNLRLEASKRGIDPARLVFAPRVSYDDHLARLVCADLFLDTLPFNAGATASDALSMGLPVLTCPGEAFAARMAGSLLKALGLPELIAADLSEYEKLALSLAGDRERLAALRAQLVEHKATASLFDTNRFRTYLEAAYGAMWDRYQHGEAPAELQVPL